MTAVPYPQHANPALEWSGAKRRYDLVREATIAVAAVTLLTVLLSILFSSPDVKPVTVSQWASAAPKDFLQTAIAELDGTSGVATYGPPYTHVAGAGQNIVGATNSLLMSTPSFNYSAGPGLASFLGTNVLTPPHEASFTATDLLFSGNLIGANGQFAAFTGKAICEAGGYRAHPRNCHHA